MVQVIKNAALAEPYLETGNLTHSDKIPSSPETKTGHATHGKVTEMPSVA
jgi:hypothetical protein